MAKYITFAILGLAVLSSLALTTCYAKEQQQQQAQSLTSRLLPAQTRARTSRSLSDMFEKVKSKIFGSKKQSAAASSNTQQQIQPSASVNSAQRQPWADINSLNQQYSPYSSIPNGYNQYMQSPQSSNQFAGIGQQPANPALGYDPSSIYSQMSGAPSRPIMSMVPGVDGQQSQQVSGQQQSSLYPQLGGSVNSNQAGGNGGLLSSASQLIAQYLSPSASSQSASIQSPPQINGQSNGQIIPSQQQSQYNEFASVLDQMVAQTGASSNQRQLQPSYNSSMVNLAEQLAPGAQFNKLISFPFQLTSNEDPAKDGRFKLHVPYLNQHVKRSDPQSAQQSSPIQTSQSQPQVSHQQVQSSQPAQQQQSQASQASIVNPQSVSQSQPVVQSIQSSPVVSASASHVIRQN